MATYIPRGSVWKHAQMNAWVVDFKDGAGRRHVIRAGDNKTVALAMLNAKLKQIALDGLSGLQSIEHKTFDEVAQEYLNHARANKRSWKRDEQLLNNLKMFFGNNKQSSSFTVKEIEDYKAARLAGDVRTERRAPNVATVNREVACLKHVFNKAIEWGYVRENPVRKVKLFKENNTRVRFLEPQERERLLPCCIEELRPVVIVALNTGLRLGELLALTWADIDLDRRLLHVRNSKTGEGRHVPLNGEAIQALTDIIRHIDSPRVFFNRDGRPYKSVRKAFEHACQRAGVKDFHFHDLRHTFASYMVMAGVDLNTVRELMGHKTVTMTMRYAHLAPQHKQAAVDRLEAFCDTQKVGFTRKVVNM